MCNKYILTLDIGGTNPRIAMMQILGQNEFKIVKCSNIENSSSSIVLVINDFLKKCSFDNMTTNSCVICVAGPIVNNSCKNPTNAKFSISDIEIKNNTYLSNVKIINDFAAIATSVSMIENPQIDNRLKCILKSDSDLNGHRAIIGPGTGFGASYLTKNNEKYIIHESEMGHTAFGGGSKYSELFKFLEEKLNMNYSTYESLISGQGIRHIMDFLLTNPVNFFDIIKLDKNFYEDIIKIEIDSNYILKDDYFKFELLNENKTHDDVAALIANNILNNPKANLAMRLFEVFLGDAARNIALSGTTTGGVFIAGGIVRKNENLFEKGDFLRSFYNCSKLNIAKYLKSISVYIIEDYDISFYGCAKVGVLEFNNIN